MVVVKCSFPECDYKTDDVSEALAIALLNNHSLAHQTPPSTATATPQAAPRGPKLERPRVNIGVSVEEWNIFTRRWEVFKTGSGIDEASAASQLFQCAGPELGDSLLKANPQAPTMPLTQLLAAMRSLAIIPVATCVLRTELLQLRQERDEQIRAFAARVRGKAETCAFTASCPCGQSVDYTDNIIRDVLLNGLYDDDIRREILGVTDILTTPVNMVIGAIESKEMARNALPASTMSAISAFKRGTQQPPAKIQNQSPTKNQTLPLAAPSRADQAKEAICPGCQTTFRIFTEGQRGWNTKPHQVCIDCYRDQRKAKRNRRQTPAPKMQAFESEPISQITAMHQIHHGTPGSHNKKLAHHIFTKGAWRRARLRDHPRVPITISLSDSSPLGKANHAGKQRAMADVSAIADTGAQSDLWSLSDYLACGFSKADLHPIHMSLAAANRSPITIEGAFFATLSTPSDSGISTTCHSMVYVSSSVQAMYLSQETLLNLGLLPSTFPHGESDPTDNATGQPLMNQPPSVNTTRAANDGCTSVPDHDRPNCSCPLREDVPPRPTSLPFPCTQENNARMKKWLLARYASSTFNTCPHRALPRMLGPPVEIHVDPEAKPRACHTPASIPLHWQQQVQDDLQRDEALGVIESVPYGEPVTWCHRMVITRKHDGSPRRTVDLSPLNKFCQRETFATESPFHLARRIPKNTWKSVTDAWNGYHSVPLRESDRHLTTFITPFGRWRYTRAPQGFVSSGDGYNRRFDKILSSFQRKERCVDDTIHYDTDLETHWWRTIDFLSLVGQSGVVLNPEKFQFAQRSVDFAGFRVTDQTIEPLPKYIDAIRDFPSPTSITDVRSWFGLVNQVSNYAQLRDIMAPFKPFLSTKCKFSWNPELETAFQQSKEAIIDAIRHGVEIFDVQKRTCLRPDWSCRGIGYFLLQQHCNCPSGIPDCCPDGWKITLAGSRFLSSAEQRYAAIEGEALAIAWGLEQTRYFTQGCDHLVVITDHKPLVKIFGDRTLDEITNTRLFRLKQRTLPWRFEIHHLPGKSNQAADAASRHPSPSITIQEDSTQDHLESALMAAIQGEVQDLSTISWTLLAYETARDSSLKYFLQHTDNATHDVNTSHSASSLGPIKDSVYEHDGVLLYQDRVIVPTSLRRRILQHLHAAHQGVSSMENRARAIVYWPGMSNDIRDTRESCLDCHRNAPSQAATPPLPSPAPSTPFEAIFADFFDYGGRHYLVVGDRLSGWVEVLSATKGSNLSGAQGLARHLRSFFATFGVPEELSSDGGPEFTAKSTEDFLKLWGVRHRISSASFPQSNGRAEVAVKTAKRLLMSNTGPSGDLDQDSFLRAMLQLRNTPDPDCHLSPAEIVFGHPLRDALAFVNRLEKFSNPHIRPMWRQAWAAKEEALRTRLAHSTEALKEHSRPLRPLAPGDRVFLQNQRGPHPTKWDRSGVIVEVLDHDQHRVKVDGSGRVTLRNRRFLRPYTPATPYIANRAPPSRPVEAQPQRIEVPMSPPPTPAQAEPPTPESPNPDVAPMVLSPSPVNPPLIECDPADAQQQPETPAVAIRPRRETRAPKRYEPETGTWVP